MSGSYWLNNWGALLISGDDAERFLQGQLTCDVSSLADKSALGAYCNLKGRMIALFYIQKYQDVFRLFMPQSIIQTIEATLKRYVLRSKVIIEKSSAHVIVTNQNFELLDDLPDSLQPENAWLALQIQSGIGFLNHNTIGLFLPQELNIDTLGGVSFTKGCFLGQEVIARLHYRGQLKKTLKCLGISLNALPDFGSKIETNEGTAQLVCAVQQAKDHWLTLLLFNQ